MSSFDVEIFKGMTMGKLMKDIHSNSTTKDRQLKGLISDLRPLITNIGDATMLVPLIKEYMDVSVKNDEMLVKMAAVAQRVISVSNKGSNTEYGGVLLSDEEKQQLLADLDDIDHLNTSNSKKVEAIANQQKVIDSELDKLIDE